LQHLFEDYLFFINQKDDKRKSEKLLQNEDLRKIIIKTGGRLSEEVQEGVFQIIISEEEDNEISIKRSEVKEGENKVISHKWILDSISNAKVLDFNNYRV